MVICHTSATVNYQRVSCGDVWRDYEGSIMIQRIKSQHSFCHLPQFKYLLPPGGSFKVAKVTPRWFCLVSKRRYPGFNPPREEILNKMDLDSLDLLPSFPGVVVISEVLNSHYRWGITHIYIYIVHDPDSNYWDEHWDIHPPPAAALTSVT